MKTYRIQYDDEDVATVEIDETKAAEVLREMVEFWMGWEMNVAEHDGDYARAWLRNLAMFILRHHGPPKDDEGWVPLDGTHGIKLVSWDAWQPDEDLISIF